MWERALIATFAMLISSSAQAAPRFVNTLEMGQEFSASDQSNERGHHAALEWESAQLKSPKVELLPPNTYSVGGNRKVVERLGLVPLAPYMRLRGLPEDWGVYGGTRNIVQLGKPDITGYSGGLYIGFNVSPSEPPAAITPAVLPVTTEPAVPAIRPSGSGTSKSNPVNSDR